MKVFDTVLLLLVSFAVTHLSSCGQAAAAGPLDGDLVSLNGDTVAEVIANEATGDVMVHTWSADHRTPRPINSQAMQLGGGTAQAVDLLPHPLATDPPGLSSRFYGRADWLQHRDVSRGWLTTAEHGRHELDFARCWEGGRRHGTMWSEVTRHPSSRGMHGRR